MSTVANAIRQARQQAGLTQEQLGRRLGLKGRAIYRWERGTSTPTRGNQRALVTALRAVHQAAADSLAAALGSADAGRGKGPPVEAPKPAVVPEYAIRLAVFMMAEELALAPGPVRTALAKLLDRLRRSGMSLEAAEQHLAAWIAVGQVAHSADGSSPPPETTDAVQAQSA